MPPMSDHDAQQPSQEEIEAYYAELREAPMGEVLMQCIGMLAAAAEAKLGRRDARAAIDGMAALTQLGEAHLGEAVEQLQGAVTQLQMAQVQVERQMAGEQGGEGAGGQDAEGAGDQPAATQPPAGQAGQGGQGQTSPPAGGRATDKLWIPGS